jgi:hypothetical protein
MNLNLPTARGRFNRFDSGMGATSDLPYYCSQPQCQIPGINCGGCPVTPGTTPGTVSPGGGWTTNAPSTSPIYANIPIGGFTGEFQVETLDSYLAGRLAAKESPFIANAIARGADSIEAEAADFLPTAQSYCAINGALPDCGQMAQLVAKYQALYRAWGAGQQAGTYQGGDTGTLAQPVNVLSGSAPTYTPPPVIKQTNVLNPPGTGNPAAGQTNVSGAQSTTPPPATDGLTAWLTANWILVAAGIGALVLLPSMMGKR